MQDTKARERDDPYLRLIAVRGTDQMSGVFLVNRYEIRFAKGDTIAADVVVPLTEGERKLLGELANIDVSADGNPLDMLANIFAKVFEAGMRAAS